MALASLGTGVLCTFGASWHVGFWRTFSVSIRYYITNLYYFILRLRISSSMEGVRSTHGKQAEQICWQDWWLSFRDVDCQPFIRRKIWSSFGSVVKIIKSVKPNNEEKTSSSAFIREPEVPATLALHPFRMWSTQYQRVTWHAQNGDACMKLTFDLHRTSSKRIKPTYTAPSSGSNRQERLVPQSWGRDSHGCCLSWLLPKMLQLQSNILDHFSIEAMPCYAHSTSHGILQHLMIVCKSAGQTCLGRAESCDLCAGRVERGRSNLAAMRILRQVRQDPFKPVATSSAFLEHRNLWKLLPNSCQTKQNRRRDNPYPVEILRLTTSDQFHTIKGHSLAFHWPLLPKNVTIDFKLHFSGSFS